MDDAPQAAAPETDSARAPTRRLLLTSVGVGDYQHVTYHFAGRTHATQLAPAAVCALIEPRPQLVGVLMTEAAHSKWFDDLAAQLKALGVAAEPIAVPEGRNEAELQAILEALAAYLTPRTGPRDTVALDLTLGLRHLPFAYLASLSYLGALRGVRLDGVYYAALDLRGRADVPILDVTPLAALIDWHAAVRSARDRGDFRALAERLRDDAGRLFKLAQGDPRSSYAANRARQLARASASALPLEAGLEAAGLHAALRQLAPVTAPLARTARLALDVLGEQTAHLPVPTPAGENDKRAVTLDVAELRRQLALAESYARGQAVPSTLIVLREWLVNLVLHLDGRHADWLERDARRQAEARLHALDQRLRIGLATPDERAVGQVWGGVHEDRNAYAHAGFRPVKVDVADTRLAQHLAACRALLERLPDLSVAAGGGERVLVTPLGLSPGVLFSAVTVARPARVVLVTSAEARMAAPEALARAGRPDLPCEILEMRDPHYGFAEARTVADAPGLRPLFASAGEVVVNVTGGTTAMTHVVQRLGEEARGLGAVVRRIGLVDRRPADEQRRDPYVLAEVVDLDA